MADKVETVVIGAGVVGLAVARALALAGREVMVLEKEAAIGTQTSSRNSEVIHAGIYYQPGSLKARLCVEGKKALYAYCAERGIAHDRCGKLIVATSQAQIEHLHGMARHARSNGVDDLHWLDAAQARALEPELNCAAALHSPSTGIVDSHGLMLSLQGDLENAGGMVACHAQLQEAEVRADGIWLKTADGTELLAQTVVNAAGLQAPDLAACIKGYPQQLAPKAFYAKGSYFTLSGRAPFSHLIYPVPEAAGLGVHLTLDLGGQAKFGPDVQWTDSAQDLQVDAQRAQLFYSEIRRYWPGLPEHALQPGYAGMRPKIHGPNEPGADFVFQGPQAHGIPGLVHLFGIESPGLTSSLAIGAHVARILDGH
ncbi:NAD(P)/FAD-dependent oxidoreductase [Comamonas composti]|uniref:NAD(P)/FAD-dependent oxidoreductase n=1 Tax=Comamonas composti TaxID=408558 RepID=UPI0004144297|nr:NAD(P)/FAD-dependent oxidoreductase [Comamonas composti]